MLTSGRHVLFAPPPSKAILYSPTWSRGTPYDWNPVTLVMGLEEEPKGSHHGIILARTGALRGHAMIAKKFIDAGMISALSPFQARTLGFNLVLFASELASAMLNQPYALEASPVLRQQAFETVSFATLHAAVLLGPTIQENADVL